MLLQELQIDMIPTRNKTDTNTDAWYVVTTISKLYDSHQKQTWYKHRCICCYNSFKVVWFPPETNMVQIQMHDMLL